LGSDAPARPFPSLVTRMSFRNALVFAALMAVVLALVKFAGKVTSGTNSISPNRVALVVAAGDSVQTGFWQTIFPSLAAAMLRTDSLTPVTVAAPLSANAQESIRQIRFNYQAGTVLEASVRVMGGDTTVTWDLVAAGDYTRVWSLTQNTADLREEAAVSALIDSVEMKVAELGRH
jgi:hypothetical protein